MAAPQLPGGTAMPALDPKIRGLWIQLPQLIAQARAGSMNADAAAHLRTMIARQGNEIMAFYRASNQPNPLVNLPPVLDPSQQAPGGGAPQQRFSPAQSTMGATASPQLGAVPPKPATTQQEQIQSTLQAMEKMDAKQRAQWFQKIPGIEAMFNKFMEMRQKQAGASRTASPVSNAASAPGIVPAPSMVASTSNGSNGNTVPSAPSQMPPMNLAIPPSAIRGTASVQSQQGPLAGNASVPALAGSAQPQQDSKPALPPPAASAPPPASKPPPSALSSAPPMPSAGETAPPLDKGRVTFYMNLSEAEAIKLPPIQHKQWLWVKNAIREQQLKAAKLQSDAKAAAAAKAENQARAAAAASAQRAAVNSAAAPPSAPPQSQSQGGPAKAPSAYSHLPLETLLQMYARTGQPITDDVRRQLSALAADGPRAGAAAGPGTGAGPVPVTGPGAGAGSTTNLGVTTPAIKSDRQVAEENVARMVETINGTGVVEPAVMEILTDLAETIVSDALDGAARVAKTRSRTEKSVVLKPQDVVTYMNQTYGIYVPGFGLPPPVDAFNAGHEIKLTSSRQRRLRHVYKARTTREAVKREDVEMEQ